MKKISEIAGGVALFIYMQQRLTPNDMDFKGFRFRYDQSQWKDEPAYDDFQQNLLNAADGNIADLQNAIEYLRDAGLMEFKDDSDNSQKGYRDFRLTSRAIQIIEGVENSVAEARNQFNITFNFNIESFAKIGSLLKAKFNIGLLNT